MPSKGDGVRTFTVQAGGNHLGVGGIAESVGVRYHPRVDSGNFFVWTFQTLMV